MDACFPRDARLLTKADFDRVFQSGTRIGSRYFRATVAHTPDSARLGLAVSRKVSTRAVQRNRIKRQIRECYRHLRAQMPGLSLVIMPKPEAAQTDNPLLLQDLQILFQRARALKPQSANGTMPG